MGCDHDDGFERSLFCARCGKVKSLADLKTVRLPGFVGVQHSTNPKIEQFWASGDPAVFHPEGRSA